jgi:hypothetical protein
MSPESGTGVRGLMIAAPSPPRNPGLIFDVHECRLVFRVPDSAWALAVPRRPRPLCGTRGVPTRGRDLRFPDSDSARFHWRWNPSPLCRCQSSWVCRHTNVTLHAVLLSWSCVAWKQPIRNAFGLLPPQAESLLPSNDHSLLSCRRPIEQSPRSTHCRVCSVLGSRLRDRPFLPVWSHSVAPHESRPPKPRSIVRTCDWFRQLRLSFSSLQEYPHGAHVTSKIGIYVD